MQIFKDKHIELLQNLIRCKSITPTDDGALDLISNYLQDLSFTSIMKSFGTGEEEVLNLYSCKQKNKNGKNLCFAGHTDVVPPGELKKWTFDPFTAVIKDDVLYGRGAVDMKSAIIAFIAATEEFISLRRDFGVISFLLTADEEGVARFGIDPMIKWLYENKVKIDQCIVGEPVSKNKVGDNIKIGARGSANFHLKIYGIQGHVAYTHLIDNPVKKANKIISDLLEYNFSHQNLIFDKTNIEVTKIDCDSGAENIVPNSIAIRFNFRYGDDYNHDVLKEIVEEIIRKHVINKDDYELESRTSGNAALWVRDVNDSTLISIAKDSIDRVTGSSPEVSTYGGTSDARFIRKYCEAIEVGLLGETAHHIDENVPLKDLETLAKIYFEMISNYF